jgi:hypothetical protein
MSKRVRGSAGFQPAGPPASCRASLRELENPGRRLEAGGPAGRDAGAPRSVRMVSDEG